MPDKDKEKVLTPVFAEARTKGPIRGQTKKKLVIIGWVTKPKK